MKLELTATWLGSRDTYGEVTVSVNGVEALVLPAVIRPSEYEEDYCSEDAAIVSTVVEWFKNVDVLLDQFRG